MPTWLHSAGDATPSVIGPGATRYYPIGGYLRWDGDETRTQALCRDSYTFANLFVRIIANTIAADSFVVSRINAGVGNQTVTIGAGVSGSFHDAVNSDAVVTTDLINWRLITGAGGVGLSPSVMSGTLTTGANTTPIEISSRCDGTGMGSASTRYCTIIGMARLDGTELRTQYRIRVGATLTNFRVYVKSNTLDGATVADTRIAGAGGNSTVTIPLGTSGAFEDAVNNDVVGANNLINYRFVSVGTAGTVQITILHIEFNSTGRIVGAAVSDTGYTVTFGATMYLPIEASSQEETAIEADTETEALTGFTAANLFVRVCFNNCDGITDATLRQNSGASTLTVSIGAATSGEFEDLVNTDGYIAADTLNWQLVAAGSAGGVTVNSIGFELQQPAAPPAGQMPYNVGTLVAAMT